MWVCGWLTLVVPEKALGDVDPQKFEDEEELTWMGVCVPPFSILKSNLSSLVLVVCTRLLPAHHAARQSSSSCELTYRCL